VREKPIWSGFFNQRKSNSSSVGVWKKKGTVEKANWEGRNFFPAFRTSGTYWIGFLKNLVPESFFFDNDRSKATQRRR